MLTEAPDGYILGPTKNWAVKKIKLSWTKWRTELLTEQTQISMHRRGGDGRVQSIGHGSDVGCGGGFLLQQIMTSM